MFQSAMVVIFSLLLANSGGVQQNTPARQIPSDTLITLERTACRGSCPIYKLIISANGDVIYLGKGFVSTRGKRKSKISDEQIRQLLAEFDKANYFDLRDRYESLSDGCADYWTDNPTVITSIRIAGKSKTISHYHGCRERVADGSPGQVFPKELFELENRIDEIVTRQRTR